MMNSVLTMMMLCIEKPADHPPPTCAAERSRVVAPFPREAGGFAFKMMNYVLEMMTLFI